MASDRTAQRLQKLFEGTGFTVTRVLYEAAPLTAEPNVYLDEPARRWAVRLPGATPRIFAYDDVLACEIAETQPQEQETRGGAGLKALLKNPARAARANAARKDWCLGMGVVVAVRSPEAAGGVARLQLPLILREAKRTSALYQRMLQYAEQLKATFDTMATPSQTDEQSAVTPSDERDL